VDGIEIGLKKIYVQMLKLKHHKEMKITFCYTLLRFIPKFNLLSK